MPSTNKEYKLALKSTKYPNLYYEKKNGIYHHYLRFFQDGKQFKRKLCVGNNHKDAYTRLIEVKKQILLINSIERADTVDNLFKRHQAYSKNTSSLNHYNTQQKAYDNHVKDVFFAKNIQAITLKDIEAFIFTKLGEYSHSYVYQMYRVLVDVYKQANNVPNLAQKFEFPLFNNERLVIMDIEVARKLYRAILEYPEPKYRSLFMFGIQGRRKIEASHIEWRDIDFTNKRYHVRPELSKANTHALYSLSDEHIKTLKQIHNNSQYIHVNNKGKPQYYFHKRWKKFLSDNDIPYISFHDLRHVLGGLAIDEGFSLEYIGQALGHKSINATKRYAKLKNSAGNEVVQAVNKLLR